MGLFGRILTWQVLPRNSLKNGSGVVGVHGLLFIRPDNRAGHDRRDKINDWVY